MGTPNGIGIGTQRLPEENIMAILDLIGVKEPNDIKDDKLSFLSAVRAISIIPEKGQVPSRKMYEAVFQILRENKSLELAIASYQLLNDLEKRFPRVTVAQVPGLSSGITQIELVIDLEVWSPFLVSSENDSAEMEGLTAADGDPIDCSKIFSLTEDIYAEVCDRDFKSLGGATEIGIMAKILMFQYLVSLLERDFSSRCQVFKTKQEWPVIRDSFLNRLLGSRRMSFKNLVKYSLHIMAAKMKQCSDTNHGNGKSINSVSKRSLKLESAVTVAEAEIRHTLCLSVQTFLMLMMELDMIKKEADQKGWTSRSDGSRTPVLEIIMDEMSYNKELIAPFLQAMTEPKWKMNIILMYFLKYCSRSVARVLESRNEETTLEDIFNCFSNATNLRSMTKRISGDVIQLLLAHGFQAYFSLRQQVKSLSFLSDNREDEALFKETCKSFITTFRNLENVYGDLEIIEAGKAALFTAATISCL